MKIAARVSVSSFPFHPLGLFLVLPVVFSFLLDSPLSLSLSFSVSTALFRLSLISSPSMSLPQTSFRYTHTVVLLVSNFPCGVSRWVKGRPLRKWDVSHCSAYSL